MKQLTKNSLFLLYKYSGAVAVQEALARLGGHSFMSILLFHRVTDEIPPDGLTVTTSWFRDCCQMLQRSFKVVPLSNIVNHLRDGQPPPQRTVAITFDDCYRDNLYAARTLAEHGLPASFFVPTQFVGTDHVFAWDRHLRVMPNLSWDDVKEMAALGHDIGSHTVTHADLGQIDEEQTRFELAESKRVLEDRLQRPARYFAYPFGGQQNFRPERLPLVYEAGYEACFSGFGGYVRPQMAGKVLPRIAVPDFRSIISLELYLTGCLGWLYSLKRHAAMFASA